MGRATVQLFDPGSKGQTSLNFNYKGYFKDFYHRLCVCVFSQMKDLKHIKRDFYSVSWVMPKGGTLWGWGCPGVKKVF